MDSMGSSSDPLRAVKRVVFKYPALPEIKLCYLATVLTMTYAYYCVFKVSEAKEWTIGDFGIWKELPLIGNRMKDVSNWEWSNWSPFALSYIPIFLSHSIIFNLGTKFISNNLFVPIYTIISIAVCCYSFSPLLVLVSVTQGLTTYFISGAIRSRLAVWFSVVPVLYIAIHHSEYLSNQPFLIYTFLSYSLLSYISFNIELHYGYARKEDDTTQKRILRMFFYTFYQPYLFSLIVLYPNFEKQLAARNTKPRDWKHIFCFAARIAFWWILTDLMLHFFYFEAILRDDAYAYSLRKDDFVSLGMAMGIFFHMKYVVVFGLPSLFAKIDNMEPHPGPICIVRVTMYSRVWREFDRGLYYFFKEYIFVPICAPTFSLPRKIFGVLVSYTFVLLWHGFYYHNIIWIFLNVVALFIEMSSKALYANDGFRAWREKTISDVNFRRVLAWLQIVPFAVGLYSNFYFLGGAHVGGAFVQRFLIEETLTLQWPFFLLICIGYFNSHTSMEVERIKAAQKEREQKEKKN